MRRSSVVQLTLLPMLATAAIATADVPVAVDPGAAPDVTAATPSETPPVLMPPGMTPTIQEIACEDDPNWRLRPDCQEDDDIFIYDSGGSIRGGFGTYFYGGGGG
jgi:hypothetical protein